MARRVDQECVGDTGQDLSAPYYFPTRAQLLRYAMELIADRVEQRVLAMPRAGPVDQWTRAILLELLPLDDDRRREFSVWFAFVANADADPELTKLKHQTAARQRELYRHLVRVRRARTGHTSTNSGNELALETASNPAAESDAALLHAVIDGLALQLADVTIDEAASLGPALLDRFLAQAIDD